MTDAVCSYIGESWYFGLFRRSALAIELGVAARPSGIYQKVNGDEADPARSSRTKKWPSGVRALPYDVEDLQATPYAV